MAFAASKTSAAQTAFNSSAVIVAALINSGAFVVDVDDVAASTLRLLTDISAPIRAELEKLVEEDQKSAPPAKPWTPKAGGSSYVAKDPGSEALTKPASEGGTSKVGGLTIREIFALPQEAGLTGKGSGADYITRLAEGHFGTANMQKKAKAFLDTLSPADKAGEASPDYLG